VRELPAPSRGELLAAMTDTAAILVRTQRIDAAVIAAAAGLRVVSRHGVGYDNVDVAALTARGIPLAIAATANMVAVAEHTLWMMLELTKRGRELDGMTRSGDWGARARPLSVELAGRTLLIVGFGRIGSRVAARARAFDMRVLVLDPYGPAERIRAAGCEPVPDLAPALAAADIVSLHCPLTPATRRMLDDGALAALRPHAIVVNTARGGLIDEAALADALRDGRLAGAGIDVFETEPAPRDHPLLGLPRALVSPHSAGVTCEAAARMAIESAENVVAALDGRLDPAVVVNPEVLEGLRPPSPA
jgi:D-3-phosphoglycerate dehydrogenase